MADTRLLKSKIEPYVRDWLEQKFAQLFHPEFLALSGVKDSVPGRHEFDAVSEDKKIVCSIKTASWKTSGGKRGAGKIQGAYAELYFLDHVEAEQKYLVLTDSEFSENLTRDARGKLSPKVNLLYSGLFMKEGPFCSAADPAAWRASEIAGPEDLERERSIRRRTTRWRRQPRLAGALQASETLALRRSSWNFMNNLGYCALPDELKREVDAIRSASRTELGS